MTTHRYIPMVLALIACTGSASPAGGHSVFTGRLVAYRPADRMQVVSGVINQELFLFRPDGGSIELLKLVYRHQGYSDLKGAVLESAQDITITVHRSPSCDQSLAAFEKDASSVPLEGSGGSATASIVFNVSPLPVPMSYRLKCYVLDHWKPVETGNPAK